MSMRWWIVPAVGALWAAMLCGCGLSPVAKAALAEARDTALARAESFRSVSSSLTSVKPEERRKIEEWKVYHQEGLDALAKALGNFVEASK